MPDAVPVHDSDDPPTVTGTDCPTIITSPSPSQAAIV